MDQHLPPASIDSACAELAVAANDLLTEVAGIEHDMWTGDQFNVAPTRVDEARQLRAHRDESWNDRDLDYVMFKCLTTMGGEATFKFILPRFLAAVAQHPDYGWTSQSHVLTSKLGAIEVANLTAKQSHAMNRALVAYARLEWAFDREGDPSREMPVDAAQLIVAADALLRHSGRPERDPESRGS